MARVVRNGQPRNDLVPSAHVDGNGGVFPKILDLYVPAGSRIADVTYGRGAFWREIPTGRYDLLATDLADGVDCRDLPYDAASVDCVVLDPPYMHSPGGTAHSGRTAMETHYRNNRPNTTGRKYHDAVIDLYVEAGDEAYRVLRPRGVLIVKCQDEVCSNRQRLSHMEIAQRYGERGFVIEDLFVVVRTNSPGVSRVVRQVHARKNHSYFLLFWKRGDDAGAWEAPVSAIDLFLEVLKTRTKDDKWTGSALENYRRLGNTTRGSVGEEFVRRYLMAVRHSRHTGRIACRQDRSCRRLQADRSENGVRGRERKVSIQPYPLRPPVRLSALSRSATCRVGIRDLEQGRRSRIQSWQHGADG